MEQPASRLTRPRHEMPSFMESALVEFGLMEAYRDRPDYQQNDYVRWVTSARRPETQQRRLAQILDELKGGDRYMNMAYHSSKVGAR